MKMLSWIFILLIVHYTYGLHIRETEYECGAHGRFEYCIDGVPGCVVGCHCHPGYYFDTDTKICEANIRLSQNYRRNYDMMMEPTRVFIPQTPPVVEELTTTEKNAVDEKIDLMTKDADELGDWLYNQFFKTIENQVMNETKDDPINTRRSESAPLTFIKKPTRRSHRYWKAKKKRRRKKKNGLKSKLLRITEDDSLFDSSSSSASDESSGSNSASSKEESHEGGNKDSKTAIDDHGHKKIVIFNKRPKPPLPSFIFLPNLETPFFPPIGLPPPPMPMYPMIPVPPMMGPFPYPAPIPAQNNAAGNKDENGNQPTEAQNNDKTTKAGIEEETQSKKPETKTPDNVLEEKDDNKKNSVTQQPEQTNEANQVNNPETNNATNSLRSRQKKRRGPKQKKLMQQLREQLLNRNNLQDSLTNDYDGPSLVSPEFLPNLRHKPGITVEEELAGLNDVDFKYLSQLIHRADLNKTKHLHPPTTPSIEVNHVLTVIPPSRRNNYDNYPYQITQILNDLTNQPSNIPENRRAYDTLDQLSYNVSNQPAYNVPNHFTNQSNYYAPNQLHYNINNQEDYNIPNQPNYNALIQPNYNEPNQLNYNVPKQPNNNALKQPIHNAYNQPDYNALNHPSNVLNQPHHNVPNQLIPNVDNQPTYVALNQLSHKIPHRKRIEDTNDVYYTNLGRQIASMIRNIDADKEVDIEIKSSNIPNNQVSTGNSELRSYWERSVRSPYTQIMNSYKNQIHSLKLSNEDLFSLENKVEIAASTERTLNLRQLENIISKMQKAKSKFMRMNGGSRRATQPSQSSFNVNLLTEFHSTGNIKKLPSQSRPKQSKSKILNDTARQNMHSPLARQNVQSALAKQNVQQSLLGRQNEQYPLARQNVQTPLGRKNEQSPLQPPSIGNSFLNDFMFTVAYDEILNATTSKIDAYQTNVPDFVPTRIPNPVTHRATAPPVMYKIHDPYFKPYTYTILPIPPKLPPAHLLTNRQPPFVQVTTSRPYYQQLNSMLLNNKALTYYNGINNNQYAYEKAAVPFRPQSVPINHIAAVSRYDTYRRRIQPSYFHRKTHHFDYFDDLL